MKYAILVGDGMADFPIPELGGKTPLEAARIPNMRMVAARGRVGRVQTIPDGMPPGSDVANLALLGYDPAVSYSGRGAIEAASLGVVLDANDTAFRCNLVMLRDGLMADYSSGHITTEESHRLIQELQPVLNTKKIRFYPGISYRHLTVIKDFPEGLLATPPHDISGRPYKPHLPQGPGSDIILALMDRARPVLASSEINRRRIAAGKSPATDIWPWGQGRAMKLRTFQERFGLRGSVISAVDLVNGLGVLAGLKVRRVAGATGYLGTNYAGKVAAARAALAEEDFVYLHIEAPDETGHEGIAAKKIQAIEEFDYHVVGEILKLADEIGNLRILVAPDHATPISIMTHASDPVPYAVCGPGVEPGAVAIYSEAAVANEPLESAVSLFERFIKGSWPAVIRPAS